MRVTKIYEGNGSSKNCCVFSGFDTNFNKEHILVLVQQEDVLLQFAMDVFIYDRQYYFEELVRYLGYLGMPYKFIGFYESIGFRGIAITNKAWRNSHIINYDS